MWRIKTLLILAAVGAASVASACGDDSGGSSSTAAAPPSTATASASALDGRSFVSTAVTGHRLVRGTEIALTFEDGRLSAQAGCNTLSAPFAVHEQTLRWTSPAAGTLIGCEPALQAQDAWLSGLLAAGVGAGLEGGTLTLTGEGATIVLAEGRPAGAAPAIVGTDWSLTSAEIAGAASSVPAGTTPPTLKLTTEGTAEVFTGCNRGTGRAQVRDDGFVVFGPLALTRKACHGVEAALERAVLRVLDGKVAAGFSGEGDLSLARSGDHLLYAAR